MFEVNEAVKHTSSSCGHLRSPFSQSDGRISVESVKFEEWLEERDDDLI